MCVHSQSNIRSVLLLFYNQYSISPYIVSLSLFICHTYLTHSHSTFSSISYYWLIINENKIRYFFHPFSRNLHFSFTFILLLKKLSSFSFPKKNEKKLIYCKAQFNTFPHHTFHPYTSILNNYIEPVDLIHKRREKKEVKIKEKRIF